MNDKLIKIAQQFQLAADAVTVKPLGEGFINDTFIVNTKGDGPRYILQRKNKSIFFPIPAMMDNIEKVCQHIKQKVSAAGGDPMREAMTIIPAHDGNLYWKDEEQEYWAVCLFIEDTIAYEAAETPELAYAGGKGIGKFQSMVADLNATLVNILPGFHDIKYRFKQWDEVLVNNPAGRKSKVSEETAWIEERRKEMLDFWKLVENGDIPTRISHNDTKINNILFDKKGEVLCVIDLDTVLSSTVLNDFGDAIQYYTNTGAEDDINLDNVSMDFEIFKAFARGYLEETAAFLTPLEIDYLAFSAKYITYEQVLRFLMDYIDGDNYYKIKSPEHNLIRTRAQYQLLLSIENQMPAMEKFIKKMALIS
jgi:hypothetical protein